MATELPTVSVIVPVRNDEHRLATCLRALQRQSYPTHRFEVVVVDNDSSTPISLPATTEVRVRLERETGPSSYAARNRGIAVSTAEILAFTDSDCIPEPDWLTNAVAALQNLGRDSAIGGAIQVFPVDRKAPTWTELYELAAAFPQDVLIPKHHFAVGANLVVWRAVIDRVGPFDVRLASGGDTEFGRRAFANGVRMAYEPSAIVRHPARRQFAELARKARRTSGGAQDQGLNRLMHLPRAAAPPLRTTLRILRSPALHGTVERAKAVAVCFGIKYLRLGFRVVFMLGMRKRWR